MDKFPQISNAEWEIMKVLWNKSPLTSSEIIDELKPYTKWSPKTIHTLINRLVKKGALGASKDSTYYEFYPLVKEEDCVKEESKSFVKKVYDGSVKMLLSNFIKEEKLSNEDIDELKKILDEKMEGKG